jgi:peptidoglycan/LPS O-acetylase OafA/YrhL
MSTKLSHRREIQGLRALAVLAVITNHLFPHLLPGGFIGVDIFFLLSGYLITGQLIEHSADGSSAHNLLLFYARRIRRILPAALLVIWVTIYLSYRYLGPVVGNQTLLDGRWSTIFAANSHFNSQRVDYFAQGASSPLLQHYWSLAVEEQFYIFWPIIILLISLISLRRSRAITISVISLVALLSFIAVFTTEQALTYFATSTRVWELALGAVIAIWGAKKSSSILQWLAFAVLIASLFLVNSDNQIPGLALLPALLATWVLLNVSNNSLQVVLGNRVIHYIGDLSFVLYLWHWPVIELHRQLSFVPLTNSDLISLFLITFVLSIGTHHLIENPIRFNGYLVQHPGITVASGVAALALSFFATFLLMKG